MTTKGGWRREGACGDATQSSHKGSRLRLSIFSKHIWIWEVRFDIHEQAIGWQMPDALYNNEKLCVPGWFRVMWSWIVEKMWHDVTEDVYTLLQRHKAAPFRPWNGFSLRLEVWTFEFEEAQYHAKSWRASGMEQQESSIDCSSMSRQYPYGSIRDIYVCLLCDPLSWHVFCHEETW